MSSKTTIVIGAGAAGLAAARDLSRAGREVIVIEARKRIGGRVFTHDDHRSPAPIELGAEFVHGKPPEVFALAQPANLQIYEIKARHWYFEDGKISRSHDFWKKIEGLMDRMKSSGADRSLKDFLESVPDDAETRRAKAMLTRYVEGFHAAPIDRVSVHGLIEANRGADTIEGDRAFRLVDGYDSLMNALRGEAESFGAKFHLNTIVKQIEWRGAKVLVTAKSVSEDEPKTFQASSAIITLPLGVLQSDDCPRFSPQLPDSKINAIKALAMGNVIKINLRFRERFWEDVKRWDKRAEQVGFRDAGFFHFPGAAFPTWWTQVPMRVPLLVGWVGGPRADGVREKAESGEAGRTADDRNRILDRAIESLALIFNLPATRIREQMEDVHLHDWRNDPFSCGAYAYVPVNGLAAQRNLTEPIADKLFFAGEATAVGHIGTVHGAMQSGMRAAREVYERSD
jgi:monoamine oxidase